MGQWKITCLERMTPVGLIPSTESLGRDGKRMHRIQASGTVRKTKFRSYSTEATHKIKQEQNYRITEIQLKSGVWPAPNPLNHTYRPE